MRTPPTRLRATLVALSIVAAVACAPRVARAGHDWNDAAIRWQPYEAGLAAASKEKKPVCLVVYTEWCPHCANYSKVFHDPKVVDEAKHFVMIRVDKDKQPKVSAKYAPDGEYVPRTYFLSSSGELATAVQAPRDRYKYFYDERDPASVLAGMQAALKQLH